MGWVGTECTLSRGWRWWSLMGYCWYAGYTEIRGLILLPIRQHTTTSTDNSVAISIPSTEQQQSKEKIT